MLLLAAAGLCAHVPGAFAEEAAPAGWPTYGGDPGGTRYSPLAEIGPENVDDLEVAWTYHTGDVPGIRPGAEKLAFQATPILQGDTLYFCSPLSRIFALDAETGEERWVYDAEPVLESDMTLTCRGVAYWAADDEVDAAERRGEAEGVCVSRVFMGTLDNGLVAVDAKTGRPCADFGKGGRVDLDRGLGEIQPGETYMTSPPTVIGDVVVTGAMVRDNRRIDAPGGVIRGFDVRTGALRWAFDPVPPGVAPLPPAEGEPRFHRGTPNAWSILSADPERGLVFVPFGNPSPDFAGGHRKGFDHYGSSTVALDAETGEPVWRFQTVHQDLWDYDVASQPTLLDVEKGGRAIAAVAQPTKMGHLFLLDRETGVPLFPVEERPVPQTDVPGETTAPTQPFPTFPKPLHPHTLAPDQAFGFTPWDRGACRERIETLRNEGIFTPPSLGGSIQYPGVAGGANWGSLAHDPERRVVVLNQNYVAQVHRLIPRESGVRPAAADLHMGISAMAGTPYLIDQSVLLSPFGVPCIPTPWGELMAVSLESGEKLWSVPFGTTRDMVPFFPIGLDFGLPSMGGPIVTKSGLVFIGAAMDAYLRAYSVETGALLWQDRLPAGGQATPMTYRVRPGGRQYVVIAAGGHGTLGTVPGDAVVAYALPIDD
ncbi:MAG: pyrroloquinoline quinone-dependent dehydrogenase [Myxococcota bacterium]